MTRETPFDCFLLGPARAWSSPGGMPVWPLPCFLVNQTHQFESESEYSGGFTPTGAVEATSGGGGGGFCSYAPGMACE